MNLHLVALPHVKLGTSTTQLCAYSGKVERFVRMMRAQHKITIYTVEGSKVDGAECVSCLSENARLAMFGKDEANRLPAWPDDKKVILFNQVAAEKIKERRASNRDLVLLVGGYTNIGVRTELTDMPVIEPFVGYFGVIGGNVHAAYESHFHMAQVAHKMNFHDVRWHDRVIPPFADPAEFKTVNEGRDSSYLLFIGRFIRRKGPAIALQIARAAKMKLMIAGAGASVETDSNGIHTVTGDGMTLIEEYPGEILPVGPIDVEQRAIAMANAHAVLMPTIYAEPGGNVAIEAMMSGTPVIAPDWGVMAETVRSGFTGFHFRTLKQAVEGIDLCKHVDRSAIRVRTESMYSLEVVGRKFDAWFEDLQRDWDAL